VFELRPYQETAVSSIIGALDRNPILVSPTGSGKTLLAVEVLRLLGRRALWLAHRKELIDQAAASLESSGLSVGVIKSGYPTAPLAHVQVASVQTLIRRDHPQTNLIVVDECFPAGTLIDGKHIETIREGNLVTAYDHKLFQPVQARVSHVIKRPRSKWGQLIRVTLSDGRSVVCTPDHPFYRPDADRYEGAVDLRAGQPVLVRVEENKDVDVQGNLQGLRQDVREHVPPPDVLDHMREDQPVETTKAGTNTTMCGMWNAGGMLGSAGAQYGQKRSSVLLDGMRQGVLLKAQLTNDGKHEPEVCGGADEKKQSDAQCGNTRAPVEDITGDRTPPLATGREWPRANRTAGTTGSGTPVAHRGLNPNRSQKGIRHTNALQGGYCQHRTPGCSRSGRQQPLHAKTPGSGSTRGCGVKRARVDRVEILESPGDERCGGLCPDGHVYNLEVEGYHNYFANGILVHNCHHAAAEGYRTILDAYPGVPRVGLTATPFRLDGRGLGDLFGELVVAAYTADLVEAGYLHAPKVWASKSPDLRGVRVTAGDYNLSQLAERTNTSELNADIIDSWKRHASGRRTVAFAVDIEHSLAIASAFQSAGIAAEHLDGKTPFEEREAILKRLRSGQTLIVSNCMVLTEGWDLPALECAIVARPTASLNLHLQMIGRIMRAAEGKESAIVLDTAGNHHVHGLVTRRLRYSLDSNSRVGFEDTLGLRRCKACGLYFDTTKTVCPECGWQVEAETRRDRPAVHGAGQLVEFNDGDFDYRREMWLLFEAQREAAGYQPGWSAYRYKDRFGDWPVLVGRELVDPDNATLEQKEQVYLQFLQIARCKGYKEGFAAHRFRDVFKHWPRGFVQRIRHQELQERLHAV